jgi:hypothetical protein
VSRFRSKRRRSASSTSRSCPSPATAPATTLLRAFQAEAAASGKPLRIHVERFNPALRLYERLGFRQIENRGVYLFMEWRESLREPRLAAPWRNSHATMTLVSTFASPAAAMRSATRP